VKELLTQMTREGGSSAAPANAVNQLLPLVYDELRELAERRLRQERANHTLQPTALVHEAYLRLVDQRDVDWAGKTHFRAIASEMMFRVLCDHARSRGREKRGGDWQRVTLEGLAEASVGAGIDATELISALEKLASQDERQFEIARMRYLGGMTTEDIAAHLKVSTRTVEREWEMIKAWLKRELSGGGGSGASSGERKP
jgi:RNA polymerase sigma factor (TIGR02999 family)